MRFKKLNIEPNYIFWLEKFDAKGLNFEPGDLGQIRLSSYVNKLQLIIKGKLFTIQTNESNIFNELALEFTRANANLVEVNRVHREKSWHEDTIQIELAIVIFNGPEIELNSIEIALDPRTLDQSEMANLGTEFDDINRNISSKCSLVLNDEQYAIAMLGVSAIDQINKIARLENSIEDIDSISNEQIKNGMILVGDKLQIAIKQYSAVEFDYLGVQKLVTRSQRIQTRALRLVKLKLSFTEERKKIQSIASQQLDKIIKSQKGYLSAWDRYANLEGEKLLAKAREIGMIEVTPEDFDDRGLNNDEMSIYINKDLRRLLTSQDLLLLEPLNNETLTSELSYLNDKSMDWKTFSNNMLEKYKQAKGFDSELSDWNRNSSKTTNDEDENSNKSNVYKFQQPLKILRVEHKRIIVSLKVKPIANMIIALSILGEQIQIERRMAARNAIVEGKSAMPHLGLIIEEGATIPVTRDQRPKINAISSFIKNKIFPKNDPTQAQKKAIEIALNTPDIAIIQGPPGTGKTTVITAIIERLNEELDKSKSVQGDILVSGYQHDAVENLLNRLTINDLPSIKFGQRSGENAQNNTTEIKLDEWRQQTAIRVFQNSPALKQTSSYIKLETDAKAYNSNPSNNDALRLLNKAKNFITGLPESQHLINLLNDLINEINSCNKIDQESLTIVRSLRLTQDGFQDDGADRAAALMLFLADNCINIKEDYTEVIRKAVIWEQGKDLSFLPKLREIKLYLLKKFTPQPQINSNKPREDVLNAIQKSLNLLQLKVGNNGKEKILLEYHNILEGNPNLVQEALSEYNLVYGATVQQAEGTEIRRFKSKGNDGKGYLQYGTIIVDEAARTSPRDLMIPMVQAKDRIILVGDHRQLPHIIDESLVDSLEKDSNEYVDIRNEIDQHISESMFQYLFKRAKELERQDGKVRTITLDAQYRSHPVLGEFASKQFYEPHGEPYKSPLDARFFTQQLDGIENKAAVWLDVPSQYGSEERDGSKSRFRRAEATSIAKQLKNWIDTEQGKKMSFGIISFYKAQVNTILEALEQYKITEKNEEGNYIISKDYQMLFDEQGKPIEERLRIGTVDSFQGMEFDVVFLSMVRSQDINKQLLSKEDSSFIEQKNVFGHLMSKNRLCVSVTRQKKLLIVVGNRQLIESKIAQQAVPELYAFYELCKGPYGQIK